VKITKTQLRRIIKEEKQKLISEEASDASIKDDIMDAIQMLEKEGNAPGTLFNVINRLYTALDKITTSANKETSSATGDMASKVWR